MNETLASSDRGRPAGRRRSATLMAMALLGSLCGGAGLEGQVLTLDLAAVGIEDPGLRRVRGSVGSGLRGVPVSGGADVDGDGFADSAFSAFQAAPDSRNLAGEVFLVFGDGTFGGEIDTAASPSTVLRVWGDQPGEVAGSEIWIEDVTGDGLGDLLICRQGYTLPGLPARDRAGALSIVVGGAALRTLALAGTPLDLRAPAAGVTVTTAVGATAGERFGIWVRTGDVTGDGLADMVVGADQRDADQIGTDHEGAAYLIRGGSHLASGGLVDLADFGLLAPDFPWAGEVARIDGPVEAHAHFGATVQIADLDGNGFGEVLVAAALSRSGAQIPTGHATGGTAHGTVYIFWDDLFQVSAPPAELTLRPRRARELSAMAAAPEELAFTDPWPAAFVIDGGANVPQRTVIDGGTSDGDFGEEILGGEDYDGDGAADLFVGDLTGTSLNGGFAGLAYVLFDAPSLRGRTRFAIDDPPLDLDVTVIHGPRPGAIAGDTAIHGDFDGDDVADLALSSPHAAPDPDGDGGDPPRQDAGTLHILLGRPAPWPTMVDLAPGMLPTAVELRVAEIYGALGRDFQTGDGGDVLAYSADAGDLDANGCPDLIVNEMGGNGVAPGAVDVGNLLLISGRVLGCLFRDGFESGDVSAWSAP